MPALLTDRALGDDDVAGMLSDERFVAAMIDVESALASVQADLGVVPEDDGRALAEALGSVEVDLEALRGGVCDAGVAVPALLSELRRGLPADPARWLHWGATSQDIVDTALVLCLRDVLDHLAAHLSQLIDTLEALSNQHGAVVMAGRTRSQIATPITFGYRAALWAQPLIASEQGLGRVRDDLLNVQFGGAVGANTAIAPKGAAIAKGLADRLGLRDAPPWHVDRTAVARLAAWLAELAGGTAKLAGDVILLSRSEIGEVSAGIGGGSSTMPQKANPVSAEMILTLHTHIGALTSTLLEAPDHAEERDGARWMGEWLVLPDALVRTGAALRHARALADTMEPDAETMARRLAATPGAMAEAASLELARHLPRDEAKAVVRRALEMGGDLGAAMASLSDVPVDWAAALDPRAVVPACRDASRRIFAERGTRE